MPCNADYMEPTIDEVQLSKVACLLDELDGKPLDHNQNHWHGYHPSVYNHRPSRPDADTMVNNLCSRLQTEDVTKLSLEMQIWWRDHQAADKTRLEQEVAHKKTEAEKQNAIAKLTPYERKLLGV